MVLFLFLGVIVGVISVVFAMQNTALVTVSFLDWHASAPLAAIILASVVLGIAVTLLTVLVGVISNALAEYTQRRRQITTVETPVREVRETTVVEQQTA